MLDTRLADFIEDELLRAPLLFDAVIDALHDQWRQQMAVAGRPGGDLARMLQLRRGDVVGATLRSLRLAIQSNAITQAAPRARRTELSLVDEDDVAADLEIGRCAERIDSEAEGELRDIHAYASALVGDIAVSHDTNPFRAEHYARALWDGCQALPAAPAVRLDAYRRCVAPLARCVRSALAAACERLAAQGVTPASYRTLVFAPVRGSQTVERVHFPPEDLTSLRDSLHGPLGAAAASSAAPSAPNPDPRLAALMRRIYDEIGAQSGLPAAVPLLLAALRPAFERIAAEDEAMIEHLDHPVWRFIDRLVYLLAATPPAEQQRLIGLARNLIDHLDAERSLSAARFAWARDKLDAHDEQALQLAVRAAAADIHALSSAAAPAGGGPLALDVGTLDTVPGEMLDQAPAPAIAPSALRGTRPGERLRVFLQREWRTLQLLWSQAGFWLLRDLPSGRHWALRPGVIDRLAAERLVAPLHMRSLVQRAAERVQRTL